MNVATGRRGFFKTLRGFVSKELKQTLRDKKMRGLLFGAPIMQLTLFGVAISNDIKNIRLFAVPAIEDYTFRQVYDRAISSGWFIPAVADRNADPFELIRSDQADAVLEAPPGGLTKALGRGEGRLQVLVNSTNVLQGQAVESYLKAISNQVAADFLKVTPPQPPMTFDSRVLYNPTLETSHFMVPGVMCLLMCLLTVILTSVSISREKEMGTFEMLISAPITPMEVILGKTVPYVILGMSNVPLILAVAMLGFHVPMRGSLLLMLFCSLIFVCSTVAVGTLISTMTKNQQQATLAGFLFLFPAILFSGLMFPLENMPVLLRFVAALNPLSHFLSILRNIMLKGGDLTFAAEHTSILFVMCLIFVGWSFKRFHTTLQ